MTDIHWFPGHMAKTIKQLKQQLSQVDIIIELLDARIPLSSRNPIIDDFITSRHQHIIGLTKTDLADQNQTKEWIQFFQNKTPYVVSLNCLKNHGIKHMLNLCKTTSEKKRLSKRFHITKVMICGIPNVGKSELINKLAKKRASQVQNKPGVTKQTKGVMIDLFIELIDTPGILWPKIEDKDNAKKLALTKAIKETIVDDYGLVDWLMPFLIKHYPKALIKRYKLTPNQLEYPDILTHIGHRMNWLSKDFELNENKIYRSIIEDFQKQRLGVISLDRINQ